ncbi:MAG: hydantoinase/oxoprolinase family protein [Deltaproteobacteria bacterium]|nr:hydantoinase/oxoprolinase family protein [Deltaproteobacteria bacterium]
MSIALGIDTGGTYTDAVLLNSQTGEICATAKSLTTRHDLSLGVNKAIKAALNKRQNAISPESISMVALSTTLATNAIAEGHGAPVCLMLIGYDPNLIRRYRFEHDLVTRDIAFIDGGHDIRGNETMPLDEPSAEKAILSRCDHVEAFAVSGYFGALNPTHELRVREMITRMSGQPVTCGHELSTRFNSIKRATTVALNARLIPIIQDLIANVRAVLVQLEIAAPLMVVKGDGSLVRAQWAMQRPIETVLSGPAASAVGAFELAGKQDVWAVDVGGTTTDIVELREGRPKLNAEGASVGGWRTMVEAVDVNTRGLGGDSHIHCSPENELLIGPKRVVPLCKLACEHPEIMTALARQSKTKYYRDNADLFVLSGRRPNRQHIDAKDETLLNLLKNGPRSLIILVERNFRKDPWLAKRIENLQETGLVQLAGFTPTDALHVLHRFEPWNAEASRKGAEILSTRLGIPVDEFCETAIRSVSKQLAAAVITKAIQDEGAGAQWDKEPTARVFLKRALEEGRDKQIDCKITLQRSIVALGAPVKSYMPAAAEKLNTRLIIPEHAEVANAIGAVSGGVIQRLKLLIRPQNAGLKFRLHLTEGSKDFSDLESAVRYAREFMLPRAEQLAKQAGADQVEIKMDRHDNIAKVKGPQVVYLGTELIFTAVGRPRFARS